MLSFPRTVLSLKQSTEPTQVHCGVPGGPICTAPFSRKASKTEEAALQKIVCRVPVVRVGAADLAPASLTLLLTKHALRNCFAKGSRQNLREAAGYHRGQYVCPRCRRSSCPALADDPTPPTFPTPNGLSWSPS